MIAERGTFNIDSGRNSFSANGRPSRPSSGSGSAVNDSRSGDGATVSAASCAYARRDADIVANMAQNRISNNRTLRFASDGPNRHFRRSANALTINSWKKVDSWKKVRLAGTAFIRIS
jgi:hypothetical protein